jgi:uncharacterized protein YjbI with pentapeptide repeats
VFTHELIIMEILKDTPFEAAWLVWRARGDRPFLTVIIKGAFSLVESGECPIDPGQELLSGDQHHDEDIERSVRNESDFAFVKPRGECFVIGSCYAPGGRPTTMAPAAFKVGPVLKKLAVIGDRHFQGLLGGQSEPVPFSEMTLCWERAFGGAKSKENPLGLGLNKSIVDDKAVIRLPNIEDPDHLILGKRDRPRPVGSFPIPRTWQARMRLTGTYDAQWVRERWPWPAKDFDLAYFNAAPEDQRIQGFFKGDEEISLVNLHPELPKLRCKLPGLRARAFLLPKTGAALRPLMPELDTITIDTDLGKAICLWRAVVEVPSESLDEFSHLFVVHEPIRAGQDLDSYRSWFDRRIAEIEAEERGFEAEAPSREEVTPAPPMAAVPPADMVSERPSSSEDSSLLTRRSRMPEPVPLSSPVMAAVTSSAFDERSLWIDIILDEVEDLADLPLPPPARVEAPEPEEPAAESLDRAAAAQASMRFDSDLQRKALTSLGVEPPIRDDEIEETDVFQLPEEARASQELPEEEEDQPPAEKTEIFMLPQEEDQPREEKTEIFMLPDEPGPRSEGGFADLDIDMMIGQQRSQSAPPETTDSESSYGISEGWTVPEESMVMIEESVMYLLDGAERPEPPARLDEAFPVLPTLPPEVEADSTALMSSEDLNEAIGRGEAQPPSGISEAIDQEVALPSRVSEESVSRPTSWFIESFSSIQIDVSDFNEQSVIVETGDEVGTPRGFSPTKPGIFEAREPDPTMIFEPIEPAGLATPKTMILDTSGLGDGELEPAGLTTPKTMILDTSKLVDGRGPVRIEPPPKEPEARPETREALVFMNMADLAAALGDEDLEPPSFMDRTPLDAMEPGRVGAKLGTPLAEPALSAPPEWVGAQPTDAEPTPSPEEPKEALPEPSLSEAERREQREQVVAALASGEGCAAWELAGADLRGLDLSGANFRGAILTGANLSDAILEGASFEGAGLSKASLAGARLRGVSFVDAYLVELEGEGLRWVKVDLKGATMNDARLAGSTFTECQLVKADLLRADLKGSHFERTALDGADLSGAALDDAVFRECTLVDTDASCGVSARRIRLDDCDCTQLRASDESDFTEGSFMKTKLGGARFGRSVLKGANLSFAELDGADFSGASLGKAKLLGCHLRNACFDKAQMIEAELGRSDLHQARFEGANLMRADLRGCNLHGAEFLNATTLKTRLELAVLTGTKLAQR